VSVDKVTRAPRPASVLPQVPTWALSASLIVLSMNVVVMFAGAVMIGVTLDEPSHVHRLQGFLGHGWFVSEEHVKNGVVDQPRGFVYAPVVALLGHVLGVVVGTEEWQTVSESADAYVVRHLVIAGLGVLGLAAVASTARLLVGCWRWGIVAAAVLSAIPLYTGHAMYNIKDLPVASGYAVATLGAVAITRPDIETRRVRVLAVLALALGIWIAAGVHPAMLVGIGASILVALGASWVRIRRGDVIARARMRTRLLVAVAGSLAGYFALVATYPKLFLRPDLLYVSLLNSGGYPWHGYTLTAGKFMAAQGGPSYYLPLWFAAQTPVVVSVLCLGAIGWFARSALVIRSRRPGDGDLLAGVAVVLVQALFLPWVAIAGGSTLYQGARQMLFVVPAIALLAAVGAWLALRRTSASAQTRAGSAVLGILIVGLAAPTVSSAALFPYEYTWFNAVTALRSIDGNWTADVEWASSREVLPQIDTLDEGRCVLVQPHTSCDRDQVSPYRNDIGSDPLGPPLGPDELWRVAYGGPAVRHDAPSVENHVGRDCRRVGGVTRHLYWRTVTMTSVERCRR
jgi:hypothetical protein